MSQISPGKLRELMGNPEKRKAFEQMSGISLESFVAAQEKAGHKKSNQLFWENMGMGKEGQVIDSQTLQFAE